MAERRFPERPWDVVGAGSPEALARVVPAMLVEELVHRGAPRDRPTAREFLRRSLRPGRLLVHGAGTHTEALLDLLEGLPGVELVGFVDKYAAKFDGFHGLPVHAPEDLDGVGYDRVLLSNELWEEPMRAHLAGCGVPAGRIESIYSDPRYGVLAAPVFRAALAQVVDSNGLEGVEFVIVDFVRPNQRIVDEERLADVFPPERTLRLYSERHAEGREGSLYRSLGFRHSHALLVAMLRRLAPRAVYLRTFIEDNPVGALLQRLVPGMALFHELYDWGLTIEPRFLREVYGHCERSIERVLALELATLRSSRFVVSKRGGPHWERVVAERGGGHASFFPQLVEADPPGPRPGSGKALRLIYAGNLPEPKTLDIDMVGALFPLFRRLLAESDVEISVFNGSHRGPEDDERFAPYANEAGPRLSYRGARPYEEIVRENARNDYGWMYFPRNGIDFIDEPVLISNKFTGYVSAGLPVILDDGWECMADLVREFDAGLVVPMREPDELLRALRRADPEAHRRGMLRLRAHLLEHDRAVVAELRRAVDGLPGAPRAETERGGRRIDRPSFQPRR